MGKLNFAVFICRAALCAGNTNNYQSDTVQYSLKAAISLDISFV